MFIVLLLIIIVLLFHYSFWGERELLFFLYYSLYGEFLFIYFILYTLFGTSVIISFVLLHVVISLLKRARASPPDAPVRAHGLFRKNVSMHAYFKYCCHAFQLLYSYNPLQHEAALWRERMSDLCRQRTLERRRQRYRERSAAETPVEKDRRLQNERAWRRRRLLGA